MKTNHSIKVISLAALVGSANAAVVAQWDFNAASGKESASTGSGTASLLSTTTATYASDTANGGSSDPNAIGNGGAWNTSAYPDQSTGSGTGGARFDASTVGFTSPTYGALVVSFDLRTSNTASRWYRIDYTTDGGTNWNLGNATSFGNAANLGDAWHLGNSVTISNLAALDNANFGFRVVSVFSPVAFTEANSSTNYDADTAYEVARNTTSNYGGGSTMRFDMVTVTAVIPEPSTALLGGLGFLALLRRRR